MALNNTAFEYMAEVILEEMEEDHKDYIFVKEILDSRTQSLSDEETKKLIKLYDGVRGYGLED